jgi:hypothetical protein
MHQDFIQREKRVTVILDQVKNIRKKHSKLGVLKLRSDLSEDIRKCGRGFGRDKFFDLLRYHDLLVKRRRKYAVTTNSDYAFYKHKNRLS